MKALTLQQPWASAVFAAEPQRKDIENRQRRTSIRGPVAIHAGKSIDTRAQFPEGVKLPESRHLARGAILGVADLVDVVEKHSSAWFTGPVGYVLANPRPLFQPIAISGRNGLWEIPTKIVREIESQIKTSELTLAPGGFEDDFLIKMIRTLAPDPADVAAHVEEVKANNPELSAKEIAEFVSDRIVWNYAAQGAALALPGTVPGIGTLAQVAVEGGSLAADVALMIRSQTHVVCAVAECYGRRGRETLVHDTLICIGLWTKALTSTKKGMVQAGEVSVKTALNKLSGKMLRDLNKKIGKALITKYGARRGTISVGRVIPFGAGVVIGGGFNYLTMKAFAAVCRNYFKLEAD